MLEYVDKLQVVHIYIYLSLYVLNTLASIYKLKICWQDPYMLEMYLQAIYTWRRSLYIGNTLTYTALCAQALYIWRKCCMLEIFAIDWESLYTDNKLACSIYVRNMLAYLILYWQVVHMFRMFLYDGKPPIYGKYVGKVLICCKYYASV